MPEQVDVDTLRDWLDQARPVLVLDIRRSKDRTEWWIPGSLHRDIYDAVRADDPSVLADLENPGGQPLVVVCYQGQTSQKAAKRLAARGWQVFSLAGGMQAWSLAWNTATFTVLPAVIVQVRRTGKGCLSYLIVSAGEAVVIDAAVAPRVYLDLAAEHKATIRYVLDTHVHADHLSRSRQLAQEAGAILCLPRQQRVQFDYHPLDADTPISFGASVLRTIPTPGHTLESVCYLLDDQALFTGDTLFLQGVGRPDLQRGASEAPHHASLLYRSLQQLATLAPTLWVLPAHTAEPVPFDRRILTRPLGQIFLALGGLLDSEETFLHHLLAHLPETPPNYTQILAWNEQGELPPGDPTALEAGSNRCAVQI